MNTVTHQHRQLLEAGLDNLNIALTSAQLEQLLAYVALLHKWNQRFNLTAVRSPQAMITRHLLDSLAILPYLRGDRLCDVGTGAGLPGVPLSIASPENSFCLLDSNHKKQVFVSQVVKSLGLKNVECCWSMVETYQPIQKFSTILTRAFAPLARMIQLTAHLLAPGGQFVAMMGKALPEELVLPPAFQLEQRIMLQVPGEEADRHLVIVSCHGKSNSGH